MCELSRQLFDDKRCPSIDNSSSTGSQSLSIWRCCYSWWDPQETAQLTARGGCENLKVCGIHVNKQISADLNHLVIQIDSGLFKCLTIFIRRDCKKHFPFCDFAHLTIEMHFKNASHAFDCVRYGERESFPAEARFIQLLSQNLNNSAKIRLPQCYIFKQHGTSVMKVSHTCDYTALFWSNLSDYMTWFYHSLFVIWVLMRKYLPSNKERYHPPCLHDCFFFFSFNCF